jgi:hypothetical protein
MIVIDARKTAVVPKNFILRKSRRYEAVEVVLKRASDRVIEPYIEKFFVVEMER